MIGSNNSASDSLDSLPRDRMSNEIKDKFQTMFSELYRIKADLLKQMKEVETKVDDKVTHKDLENLDNHLSNSLD